MGAGITVSSMCRYMALFEGGVKGAVNRAAVLQRAAVVRNLPFGCNSHLTAWVTCVNSDWALRNLQNVLPDSWERESQYAVCEDIWPFLKEW